MDSSTSCIVSPLRPANNTRVAPSVLGYPKGEYRAHILPIHVFDPTLHYPKFALLRDRSTSEYLYWIVFLGI